MNTKRTKVAKQKEAHPKVAPPSAAVAGKRKEALTLLTTRFTEAHARHQTGIVCALKHVNQAAGTLCAIDPDKLADVAFGCSELLEAATPDPATLPSGRLGTLEDLQRKAEAAGNTHDPEIIQNLLTALAAFLGEEINETDNDEEDSMKGKKTEAKAEEAKTEAAKEESAEAAESAAGDEDTETKKEADDTSSADDASDDDEDDAKREAAAKESFKCEACGHENDLGVMEGKRESKREAQRPSLKEATVKIVKDKLTEADRADLMRLRAGERRSKLLVEAAKAIADEKLTGIYQPEELVTFDKSQWPTLLSLRSEPPRSYGSGERPMPAGLTPKEEPKSARAFFESRRGALPAPKDEADQGAAQ